MSPPGQLLPAIMCRFTYARRCVQIVRSQGGTLFRGCAKSLFPACRHACREYRTIFRILAQYAHFHVHPTLCSITVIEAVKHISLFAHFLSGIAVLVFYYCGNQEEKDKYLNRILVACMSLLFMAIALPPFGLPKPESHDLQTKGFTVPKISQEPLKKKKA